METLRSIWSRLPPWAVWVGLVALFLATVLPHLGLWPRLAQDEMQIIDLGRVARHPDTDWSTSWLLHESMPLRPVTTYSVALQSLAYEALLPSTIGSRLSSLAGAILASWLALGWLRRRGAPGGVAVVLAVALLADPIFNDSYRQGRLDSWAFALCFAACWLIRAATARPGDRGADHRRLFVAGAVSSLACFVWPTSIALMPLVLVELFHAARSAWSAAASRPLARAGGAVLAYGAGGTMMLILGLLPVLLRWESLAVSWRIGAEVQRVAAAIQSSIVDLYMLHDPWLVPALLLALLLKREIGVLLALALAVLMMQQTMVYTMRVLYLLPYFLVIIAAGASAVQALAHAPRRRFLLGAALAFMLLGNLWESMLARPWVAMRQAEARAPAQFETALGDSIGRGPLRVLTTEWDVYHAARALGWKTYLLFGPVRRSEPDYLAFLQSMDFAITRPEFTFAKPYSIEDLTGAGFVPHETISFATVPEPRPLERALFGMQAGGAVYRDLVVLRNAVADQVGAGTGATAGNPPAAVM